MHRRIMAAGILVLAVLAAFLAARAIAATNPTDAAPSPDAALIAKGEYLATAGDCVSCHTAPGGQPMAGGLALNTPFGKIYTPNITPDAETGIGKWSEAQFYAAMHDGLGAHGEYLYPAMPFPWYTKVTREDVDAIRAYIASLPPVRAPNKPDALRFPFNIRGGLVAWRAAFFKAATFEPDSGRSAELNRGAYLVQGLGHCGECHNGNVLFGAGNASGRLQGGPIDDWYAPNITGDSLQGIGGWSDDQLVTFLKTGAAPGGAGVALGPMMETIHNSLSRLTDDDLRAIAAYLKSTPGKATYDAGKAQPTVTDGQAYLDFCASCHQQNGDGVAGEIPALAGSGVVKAKEPQDIIRVVLGGLPAQKSYAAMPAIGAGMTDAQVAAVANYIRTAWGNGAPPNAQAGLVARLRSETHTLMAVNDPQACPTDQAQGVVAQAVAAPDGQIRAALNGLDESNVLQRVDAIVPKLRTAAPKVPRAGLLNGMLAAYCPILAADDGLTQAQRAERLGVFAEVLYGELARGSASQ